MVEATLILYRIKVPLSHELMNRVLIVFTFLKTGAPGLAASARSALRPSSSSPRVPSPSSALVPGTSRGGSKCLAERRQALDAARRPGSGIYIPKCKEDGYYAKVQCHQATGYCWCATGDGKPIPGSSVKGKNINCRGTKGKNIP